jgi:hypothetical protein
MGSVGAYGNTKGAHTRTNPWHGVPVYGDRFVLGAFVALMAAPALAAAPSFTSPAGDPVEKTAIVVVAGRGSPLRMTQGTDGVLRISEM